MPFDSDRYARPALQGDVGYCAYVTQMALASLVDAIEKIAGRLEVDVSSDLESARNGIDILQRESDNLAGWRPE